MTADTPFHAASVGKIFTAASIARLVDQGGMSFDDPVSKHLPRDIMDGLHVYGGMDYSGDILIRHLLAHTSGLPDFFFDVPESGGSFIQTAKKDPTRVWTPEDTVRFAVEKLKPFFPPGRDFHYTDTEYNLLGLIIERVSGLSLAEVFSRDFFLPLGMSDSFLYTGNPRDSKIAHVLFGGWDVTGNVPMITASWGGGGVVSTLERMSTDTRVFEGVGGIDYGYGLMLLDPPRLSPFLSGFPRAWGHSGSTGAFLYYCPELDAVLAGTLDQQATEREHVMLVLEAIGVLMRLR
jgi:D-alanyl-D-alanine carboxypeptidase